MENNAMQIGSIEKALMTNDLSSLTTAERGKYYTSVCESLGLNPLTQPFGYIELAAEGGGKKLTLYAKRDAADQLRRLYEVSIEVIRRETIGDLYVVAVKGTDKSGRTDEAIAAVPLKKPEMLWDTTLRKMKRTGKIIDLSGEALANAWMKCETKAKRRVTLSICGLGWLDETEVESIKENEVVDISESPPPQIAAINKPALIETQAGPFFYDLTTEKDEAKAILVSNYLYQNGGVWFEELAEWKSEKLLKKAVSYLVKKEKQEAAQKI